MELNLVIGKINFVLPILFRQHFNSCIKNSKCLHFNIEAFFEEHRYYNMSPYKFSRINQFNKGAS